MKSQDTERRLTHAAILDAAAAQLEEHGRLTMRALAERLGADPMAVYHYFPNKDALLTALAGHVYQRLDDVAAHFSACPDWQARLALLAEAYRALASGSPVLVQTLARGGADASQAIERFSGLYSQAVAGLGLAEPDRRAAMHALVDFIHGYALAGTHDVQGWRASLNVIALGIGALAAAGQPRRAAAGKRISRPSAR